MKEFRKKHFVYFFSKSDSSHTGSVDEKNVCGKNIGKILSTDLCLKVCSLILEHIEDGMSLEITIVFFISSLFSSSFSINDYYFRKTSC